MCGEVNIRSATSQSKNSTYRQYVVDGPDGKPRILTHHPADAQHSRPHWHAAVPKFDPDGSLAKNKYGSFEYERGGSVEGY